jgi:hypothetical protein
MAGSGSTAHRPLAKTDQWSVILCLIPRVRIPSRPYYHPLSFNRLQLLNRRRWLRSKARSRSHRVTARRIVRVLWPLRYRRSTCIHYRLEHSRLRFRRYRLRLHWFLFLSRRQLVLLHGIASWRDFLIIISAMSCSSLHRLRTPKMPLHSHIPSNFRGPMMFMACIRTN